ncbi:MAG: T9SS type A sorting domain-containing protein [Cytophagaceae bacterium]
MNYNFRILKWTIRTAAILIFSAITNPIYSQVPANINSGNPSYPFPQFKGYTGGAKNLAHENPVGVPHAEMEQRIRDAYTHLCNSMSYQIYDNGTWGPVTVAGVKYISPNHNPPSRDIGHCYCVEGDGYYLLAAAYMADKPTFDGYYMWIHDRQFQKTRRFIDCVVNNPGYYGNAGLSGAGSTYAGDINQANVRGGGLAGGSPLDGSEDVALALLMAWKQWGDDGVICIDPCTGSPVTYKDEALKYIKAQVELTPKVYGAITKYVPGVIGLDGYRKSGDVSKEMTAWGNTGAWMGLIPDNPGPATCGDCEGIYNGYADYAASGYFRSFADVLEAEGEPSWYINQYRRGEASDDWIMGQAYNQGLIPWAGLQKINEAGAATTVEFGNMVEGEDFRYGWRTILNYLWNGTPSYTWDPASHNYVPGTNSYEYNMALRFANFIKNPQSPPYNNPPETIQGMDYCGPATGLNHYAKDGTNLTRPGGGRYWPLAWIHGTGSPAAVVSQDFDLMAQMFREAVLKFDVANDQRGSGQRYADAKPMYFHEWFRLLGMLVLTGNFPDPLDVNPALANMKVYKSVNKTYAAPGDTITFTISYRNYAKATANNVTITDALPSGSAFINASNGGTFSGGTVTWNLGNVPGYTTGNLAATTGSVTLRVLVTSAASGRICNTATISCSNGSGWTSNEYPNNITDVMERNCVDIINDNPLTIKKTASKSIVMAGDTISYTIVVKNKPVPFLNGGRPGVRLTFGYSGATASSSIAKFGYRIYHGAHEPIINYKNYRVSYFGNKPGPPAYTITTVGNFGCTPAPTLSSQSLPEGTGWNHRLKLTFPDQKVAPTLFVSFAWGDADIIHEGALVPHRVMYDVNAGFSANWTNDWSYEPGLNMITPFTANDPYFPFANDWTDPLSPNQPVTKYIPYNCSNNVVRTVNKQLVEEWDGYTWRRVAGTAPLSGRELNNIITRDTLPSEVTFVNFFPGFPVGTISGNVITWPAISTLAIGDSIVYKFWVKVNDPSSFGCPSDPNPSSFTNRASAKADREQLALSSATTLVSCTPVTVVSPSMTKTADKSAYSTGEPITYTIKYKNLDGTVVNQSASAGTLNNTLWNAVIGSKMNSDATGIAMNSGWTNRAMVHTHSHGTNGTIRGTLNIPQYSNIYAVILRHNGSTWTEVRFSVQYSTVDLKIYNMPAGVRLDSIPLPKHAGHPAGDFDFQIQLNNGNMNLWIKDPSATFSTFPQAIVAGIPVQAGYAGIRALSSSTAAYLKSWYTHLDSDFNLQMTDPIPSQITYVAASNAVHNAVSYTGSNLSGTVTWQTIPGPVLANEEITFVWNGIVNNCVSTIKNTAYAKIQGVNPDPAGEVIVNCNSTTPVTFLYFSGKPESKNALLSWATTKEKNNSHFVIEKSTDGINFYSIGKVKGKGSASEKNEYQFIDKEVSEDIIYYRLIQTDFDGTETKTNTIVINFSHEEKITLYPNPYNTAAYIKVISPFEQNIYIRIESVSGELVSDLEKRSNDTIQLGEGLAEGMYLVKVFTNSSVKTFKLVKK